MIQTLCQLKVRSDVTLASQGISIASVCSTLAQRGVHYTPQQVREAAEFLTNEGHLYSTIDDNHYQAIQN